MRVYNFSAGPSALPLEVLEEVQRDLLNFSGTGMSVTEISHRSGAFSAVVAECESLLRELMHISDDYAVIFVQGGASTQFSALPLNLMHRRKADYVVTGNFSKKAFEEGSVYGDAACVASSADKNFTYIPDLSKARFREGTDYVHICSNNTVFGTRYTEFPQTEAPLVADMSSDILSREIDVNKFGVIYAGGQKNLAPAGVTLVIARRALIGDPLDVCPTMLKWNVQDKEKSLYNTPPCFSIYVATLVLRRLKRLGGIKAINEVNEYKAGLLYGLIDDSAFYTNRVEQKDRSIMNAPFTTPSAELDAKFIEGAAKAGLVSLKGHRSAGGMRASIYNAMPVEGVKALVAYMKKFEKENA